MHPSKMQPLYTLVNKLVTTDVQICFPTPYHNRHAKYSHMPNMPQGRTSPDLPHQAIIKLNHGMFYRQNRFYRPCFM